MTATGRATTANWCGFRSWCWRTASSAPGWASRTGAAMGEPLEFAFNGRMFLGAVDVQEHALREWLVNEDDLYMNMAMLAVVADNGLAASSDDFAAPYRQAKFLVWHANGQARQNVLAGTRTTSTSRSSATTSA